jgi:hypothetical protein
MPVDGRLYRMLAIGELGLFAISAEELKTKVLLLVLQYTKKPPFWKINWNSEVMFANVGVLSIILFKIERDLLRVLPVVPF